MGNGVGIWMKIILNYVMIITLSKKVIIIQTGYVKTVTTVGLS